MSTVVFTGRGFTPSGKHLTRQQWEQLTTQAGHNVRDKVDFDVTYLVAANPNSGTSKIRAAALYGVQVVSYAEWFAMLFNVADRVQSSVPQPLAAPTLHVVTQDHVDAALDVRKAILGYSGRFAGEIGALPCFNRKPSCWGDVDEEIEWDQIAILRHYIPILNRREIFPSGSNYEPCDDFSEAVQAEFDKHNITTLIVQVGGRDHYLVNTEGYGYCRYVCRIAGFTGLASPVQVAQPVHDGRKRRAIVL
jgi:hypothetical protein